MNRIDRDGRIAELNPIADDGDEIHFCSTCAFGSVCLPAGVDKSALQELHVLVEHVGPYRAGEHIFRRGERFGAIFAVRGGVVKTCLVDDEGHEQVLGFHLPGEMIGLNAIHPEKYPCDAVALDTVYVCRFSFAALTTLAAKIPDVQQTLFRLLSADIGKATALAGDHTAEERLAAFLLDLAKRYASRGFSSTRYRLVMPRGDIANHLRLASETVSRVLRRFCDRELIRVDGRELELLDREQLRKIARNLLPE
ncbi:helix-turn-helix domain-containing protein [Rudaea sp.]|uniref:helix-turn-helix domain-containing protein n=1 Tax=Rudaea sp. TaxID=2136325 RepID=UPI0032209A70